MLYLLQELSAWLIGAFAIGLVVGSSTCDGERRDQRAGWPLLGLFLYALGAVAAFLKLLPGRAGFWLETALLLSAAYFIGCLSGCLLRALFAERPAIAEPGLEAVDPVVADGAAAVKTAAGLAAAAPAAAQKLLANDNVDATSAKAATPLATDFVEGAKSLEGQAAALAAAAPAALAASSEAQKLLAGGDPVAKTEAPVTTQAPSGDFADGAKTLADHAGALAAAAPAALAAASEAQKLLTGGDPVAKTEAPATTQAPSGDLSDGVETLGRTCWRARGRCARGAGGV